MKHLYPILAATALLLSTCTPGEVREEDRSTGEQHLRELLEDYYQTLSARNWPHYASFFSEQATLSTIWKPEGDPAPRIFTTTIDSFLAQTAEGPDSQPVFEEKMLDAEISIRENLAQAWVRYEAKFGTEGHLMEWSGYDLFSFIRFNNEWKIVSLAYATADQP